MTVWENVEQLEDISKTIMTIVLGHIKQKERLTDKRNSFAPWQQPSSCRPNHNWFHRHSFFVWTSPKECCTTLLFLFLETTFERIKFYIPDSFLHESIWDWYGVIIKKLPKWYQKYIYHDKDWLYWNIAKCIRFQIELILL